MLQSLIIYGLLTTLMVGCGVICARIQRVRGAYLPFNRLEVWLPILCFAAILGARYDVGIDHLSYLENYTQTQFFGDGWLELELLFWFITKTFAVFGLHFFFYFFFLAFLQIFFLYYATKKEQELIPFVALLIMTGYIFTLTNVIRQNIACCIFLCLISFIRDRKFWYYTLGVLLCFMFHRSAIILLPLYFILKGRFDFSGNRPFQYILLVCALILGQSQLWTLFNEQFITVTQLLGYGDKYSGVAQIMQMNREYNYGPRALIILATDVIAILYSARLKKVFADRGFVIYYNLYFGYVIFSILFAGNLLLMRPVEYFVVMKIMVLAYLFYYLFRVKRTPLNLGVFFFLLCLQFLYMFIVIYLGEQDSVKAAYHFFWEAPYLL